eukprot:Gregarina_sp_Pseudo_9__5340@NODE_633_length_2452_cov_19_998342_g597_i0_p1_GENE_NODE_633_length_2452_cov_19_998342_g597_i0NODE_633_length_2452_cov_19_998342_g597_i0_p1_ORF_typecomplete_len285_score57_48Sec66/PF09802_9/1_4e13DUF2851/PF11013_8/0_17DUF2851/PF11013_8/1_2e02ASFV_J13L/PF05568_11/0_29ASFV_J13L/PF05568_11/4_4e02Oantigen_lig/PF13425_6/0_24Neur_chan_memb/PF02932_16/0_41_NODE_633_length_2452_cov_19_998342_g597_i04381292
MMEPWMIVCLVVLLGVILFVVYTNVASHRQKQRENAAFMEEADTMLGFRINFSGREEYEKKLEAVFNEFRDSKKWDPQRLHSQDPQVTDPVEAWQRELPADRIKTLKAQLIKRMVNLLGQATLLPQELQTRFIMFQKGLISENQWRLCAEAKNQVDEEVLLIKFEAECLQDTFGDEGTVFKEANKFYQHELQKKKAEMNRNRLKNIPPEKIKELVERSGGRLVMQPAPETKMTAEAATPSTEDPAEKLRMRKTAEPEIEKDAKQPQCEPSLSKNRRNQKRRKSK